MIQRPKIAIVDSNVLSMIGLKQILEHVMPIMDIKTFSSVEELEQTNSDVYFHYFVAQSMLLQQRQFFIAHQHKTIVLTQNSYPSNQPTGFHCISTNVTEEQLVRSILMLEQYAHAHGKNLPAMPKAITTSTLSAREIEVLGLIVQGYINKEIADRLNIGITTVITHRKNIMEKLGMKSVSGLTIYAVMHGYVDINDI